MTKIGMSIGRRGFSLLRVKKRFYKHVSVSHEQGGYTVELDHKKIKTPFGNILQIPIKTLAAAVAQEWAAQKDVINGHAMHLTALCNTCIDNPLKKSKKEQISQLLNFLHTDTICTRADSPEQLTEFEKEHWDPLMDWFCGRYGVELNYGSGILAPEQPEGTMKTLDHHMNMYNPWQLNGIQVAVDSIKSLVITMAVLEGTVNVDTAVFLARLETEFQTRRWGNVEWYHDIEAANQRAQLAAGTLFCDLCRELPDCEDGKESL